MSYYRGDDYSTNMDEASMYTNAMEEASYISGMNIDEASTTSVPNQPRAKTELYNEIRGEVDRLLTKHGLEYGVVKRDNGINGEKCPGNKSLFKWIFQGQLDRYLSKDINTALLPWDNALKKEKKERAQPQDMQRMTVAPQQAPTPLRGNCYSPSPRVSSSQQSPVPHGALSTPPRHPLMQQQSGVQQQSDCRQFEQSRRNVNAVPQPSLHHVEQQQYPSQHNSPDEMSLASAHTQQSTAAMSLASNYNQMDSSINSGQQQSGWYQGGNDCYSPAPGGMNNQQLQASPRRSKSYQKKSRSTVSPKRQEFRSASQRRQKSSAISRSARDEQYTARRQQLPQPTDLRDLFSAPSSGGNQPYENVQQRSTQMPVGLPTQPEGGGHMSISDPASDGSQPYLSHEKMTAPQPQGYRLPASEGNQSYLPNKNTQEGFNFNAPQGELGFDTPAPPSQDMLPSNTSSAHRGANGGGTSGLYQRIFSGPAFQNFRESSDHLSSSQDNTLCINRDLPSSGDNQPYSGFLELLAHLEQYAGCQLNPFQVGDLRDIFIDKVDVSRGVPPQMEFETLDDLLAKIRMVPNEQDAHELLIDEITAGWFTDVIRQKKTNLLGSIRLALKGVDNSQRLASKKANRISNFYAVSKAIVDKIVEEEERALERLQKKVQASRAVQTKAAERIIVLADQKDLEANYKANRDVLKSLELCLKNNVVPPPSVVQAALDRFTIIDDHWKDQLRVMAGEYQDDGTILSSSSRSTLRTLTEFFAHINLGVGEAGVEQRSNTMVPTHFTANGDDDEVSKLGMTSVYQHPEEMAAVPNIQPNNHVQRATSPSPSDEDASAAAINDAMSQLQMSVPSVQRRPALHPLPPVQVEEASTTSSMRRANEASKLCPDENDSCKFMCEITKKKLEP